MPHHFEVIEANAAARCAAAGAKLLHRYAGGRALVLREGDAREGRARASSLAEPEQRELLHVHGRAVAVPASVFRVGSGPRLLLRFAGPIAASWVVALERAGGVLHFFCSPFGLCASLGGEGLDRLRAELPALLGAQPYEAAHCSRETPSSRLLARATGVGTGWLDVVCFDPADRERVIDALAAQGARVLSQSRYKLRVTGAPAARLRDVVGVKLVGEARGAVLAQAELYAAVRHPEVWPTPASERTWRGRGEVVAVADTGLDRGQLGGSQLHADFRGRVRALQSWPLNAAFAALARFPAANDGGADGDSGHGTHVAGLVLGDGASSSGQIRGIAPEAELVFQALEQYTEIKPEHARQVASGHYLSGRPLDLRELFERAREAGARIHVNAWGDPASGHYTDDCYEADAFLAKNPDAVVLFAAGNTGEDRNGDGRVEAGSLYAPASAKNVIAVGATEGPRLGVGLRDGWRAFDPSGRRFRSAEVQKDPISGQPERLAMFSSAGPTADGRIKPDLCAPGTNLVSTRSQATATRGWGLASPLPHYMYLGGTSMAVAIAGGAAAVLRGALREALGQAPSGPALKALLLYGAAPIVERDGKKQAPIERVGFGRLSLADVMPGNASPTLLDEPVGVATAEAFERRFTLAARTRVRAVLCWYDAPGERLINDLDLSICEAPTREASIREASIRDELIGDEPAGEPRALAWGNHPEGAVGTPDRANTVERIDLELPAGRYLLRVDGFNVPTGRQPFALVLSVPLEPVPRATWAARLPLDALNGIGQHLAVAFAEQGLRTLADFAARPWAAQPERLQRLDAKRGIWQGLWSSLQGAPPAPPVGLDPKLPLTSVLRAFGPSATATGSSAPPAAPSGATASMKPTVPAASASNGAPRTNPPPSFATWLATLTAGLDRAWFARLTVADLD